jgi:hypothetical protein
MSRELSPDGDRGLVEQLAALVGVGADGRLGHATATESRRAIRRLSRFPVSPG